MATKQSTLNTKKIKWITDFQGLNQRQDVDKIPDNGSYLLVNISLDRPGTWSKRKGYTLLGVTAAGSGVQTLINYAKTDGTNILRVLRGQDIAIYTESTNSLDTIYTHTGDFFDTALDVQAVNYKDRVYYVGTTNSLAWEDGVTNVTKVGSGTNEIRGNSLAVAQNTLYVGGVTYLGNATATGQNRVYYSLFDSAGNQPGDQLYNTSPVETMATSTRYFTVPGPVKGLFSFGLTGFVYVFTANGCYEYDIRYSSNQTGPRKVFGVGLMNPRAITECNGWMVWMDTDARLWAWGGTGMPTPLSWDIDDDEKNESIVNVISASNYSTVCAGSFKNKFWFSLGNITLHNTTVTNAVLCGLIPQNFQSILWRLDSFPVKPAIFTTAMIGSKQILVFGSSTTNDIYKLDYTSINDNNVAISATARTKFFDMGEPFTTKSGGYLYVIYRPQPTQKNYLRVKYAVDNSLNYVKLSDPDSTTPVTSYGVIDMYEPDSATRLDQVGVIQFPNDVRGRTISVEVGNSQPGEDFEIQALGFSFDSNPLDIRPKSIQS